MSEPDQSTPTPADNRLFRILALDGGGYKGMFSAAILDRLEQDLQVTISERFDLIAGTSTGAIIALGLGIGLRPADLLEFYLQRGHAIFPQQRRRSLRRLTRSKYNPAELRQALQDALGEATLGDSKVPLVIPTYDLCNDDVHLFRTPHAPNLRRDHRELMVDVALAATAAPTYLPAHPLRGLRLIDGGMWANNPTMIAVVEAVVSFSRELTDISVLSIGTTADTTLRHGRLDHGGIAQWARDATELVIHGQSLAAANHAGLLLGADRFLRVNPSVPAGELRLDRLTSDQLLGRAERESRHISSTVQRMFASPEESP